MLDYELNFEVILNLSLDLILINKVSNNQNYLALVSIYFLDSEGKNQFLQLSFVKVAISIDHNCSCLMLGLNLIRDFSKGTHQYPLLRFMTTF